jgi:hypothetical protein
MPIGAPRPEFIDLDGAEVTFQPWSWPFAADRRDEIDRHFAHLRRERPRIWNGRVLLLNRYAVRDRALHGACFETDYANLCAWRDWNFPDPRVANVYGAAALRSGDGAYLVGEMASYTAAAGQFYFPCGTLEPADLDSGGVLDFPGNLRRELKEETGLDVGELEAGPGWSMVIDRCYIGLMKRLTASQNAERLRSRIMDHIAGDAWPEFTDIRIVRGPADLDPRMSRSVIAFLEREWRI